MIKNIIANYFGKFWALISGFLFIPLYIKLLGFESYSIISFTLVISGLMVVLDAGLTATLSRELARVDNSKENKIRIFKTLESSYFIISSICIILLATISGIISTKWLNLDTVPHQRVSLFLKIISFDVGFQLLFRFYLGGLLGLEKQVKANFYQVSWGILRNGFVILAILIVPSLEMFFIWQTISTIIFAILIGLSLRKALTGQYKFDFQPKIEKSVFKSIWRFSSGMLLISLVASLNTQMDKVAISRLLPLESLGYYTLAVSLSMVIIVLVNPISVALLPRFTSLYSAGERLAASSLFYRINLFVVIFIFAVMANMVFCAKELIWIWTGNLELSTHATPFLPIIVISFAMLALATIPYNIAIANGYTKLNNLLGLISLIITLPGYWIATKQYGAIGAAYVFCIVQSSITLIYLYFINKKFLDPKRVFILYIKQLLIPMIIALGISFGFSLVSKWAEYNRFVCLIWFVIATACTFIITLLILMPWNDIRKIIKFG